MSVVNDLGYSEVAAARSRKLFIGIAARGRRWSAQDNGYGRRGSIDELAHPLSREPLPLGAEPPLGNVRAERGQHAGVGRHPDVEEAAPDYGPEPVPVRIDRSVRDTRRVSVGMQAQRETRLGRALGGCRRE
jgi:hypothetical protein